MNYFFALLLKSRTVFGQQPSKTTFETPYFRAYSGDYRCEIKSPHPDYYDGAHYVVERKGLNFSLLLSLTGASLQNKSDRFRTVPYQSRHRKLFNNPRQN